MKPFGLIYADPPWQYRDRANAGRRGAAHKYPVMKLEDICSLPIQDLAAQDCLLAMWWTGPMVREAIAVVDAWGFRLVTMKGFTWHKLTKHGKSHIGMGHWSRANTEDCLFAVRGHPKRADAAVRQFVQAPRGAHSEKPGVVRDLLLRLVGGGGTPRRTFCQDSHPWLGCMG